MRSLVFLISLTALNVKSDEKFEKEIIKCLENVAENDAKFWEENQIITDSTANKPFLTFYHDRCKHFMSIQVLDECIFIRDAAKKKKE